MKTNVTKKTASIIFFGSVWGILEATLGYVFHFIPNTISGMLMFPIANIILVMAYKATGSRSSLLYMGLIAAAIKSVDFLLPGLSIFKTINPMISIVLESMVVAIVCPYLVGDNKQKEYIGALTASISWRAAYMLYLTGTFIVTGSIGKYIASFQSAFTFLIFNGVLSGILAIGVLWVADKFKNTNGTKIEIKPFFAIGTLALAVVIQYLL
jgi:uncharacterized membrane protein